MCLVQITRLWVPFQPITAPYFTLLIKPWDFAKRQCKRQWLTPPILGSEVRVTHDQGFVLERLGEGSHGGHNNDVLYGLVFFASSTSRFFFWTERYAFGAPVP